ncbi:unnamed protein product, partial [Brachionus calyciflorus]
NCSIGRNVRVAACYACYSNVNSRDPDAIAPYIKQLAGALLIVTVFDLEVKCRRASLAVFQETLEKYGQLLNGKGNLAKWEYYEVGQIQNCFLDLAIYIAGFEEYRQQIIEHLIEHKFNHWDYSIRELTSQCLSKL